MPSKEDYKQVIERKLSAESEKNQKEAKVTGPGQNGDTGNVSITNK